MILGPFNLVAPPLILGPFDLINQGIDIVNDYIPSLLNTDVQKVTVFKQRGNRFRVTLLHDGQPVDLSLFTRFKLYGFTAEPIDTNVIPNVIDWNDGEGVINVDVGDIVTKSGTVKTILEGFTEEYGDDPIILWHPILPNARVTAEIFEIQ